MNNIKVKHWGQSLVLHFSLLSSLSFSMIFVSTLYLRFGSIFICIVLAKAIVCIVYSNIANFHLYPSYIFFYISYRHRKRYILDYVFLWVYLTTKKSETVGTTPVLQRTTKKTQTELSKP